MTGIVLVLGLLGWLAALAVWYRGRRHICPVQTVERVIYQPPTTTADVLLETARVPQRIARAPRWPKLWARFRARKAEVAAIAAPETSEPVALLYGRDGQLESVRRMRGEPPAEIFRPHGRAPATRYIFQRREGARVTYQAEA